MSSLKSYLGNLLYPLLTVLAFVMPLSDVRAESRYNDWELWSSPANAVLPAKRGPAGPLSVNVAAGAVAAPEFLGSDTIAMKPLPLLDVNYAGKLFLSTQQGIGWNAWHKRTLRAGPRITFDFGRTASDSPSLAGLPDIEVGTELGLFIESFVASWRFKGDIRKEVGGGHGGVLLNGEAAWGSRWSKKASFILGARVTYMDDTYAESYFSVAGANATAARPAHAAAAGFRDINAYAQIVYDFTQSLYVATELRGTNLFEQAADSPIAESDVFFTGSLMVGYRF
ncbi:MAG: MipA/OmpV family protein [Rhodospirillaceae bacterium]|nr:MipA/OmpV family protein [Rhodospirillaceae bacterium]MBT6428473.1 MipA/OmpV family protein [Rhodospirillaceae bacterium]